MLRNETIDIAKILTYFKFLKKNGGDNLKSRLQTEFGNASDSQDFSDTEPYECFLLKKFYKILNENRDNYLATFYICEIIYTLKTKGAEKVTAYDKSVFKILSQELIFRFEPKEISKDDAILANYFLCFALIRTWLIDFEISDCNSSQLREQFSLLQKARDCCRMSKKYAKLVSEEESIFSEENLEEVGKNLFLKEVENLEDKLKKEIAQKLEKCKKETIEALFNKFADSAYETHMNETNHVSAQKRVVTEILKKMIGTDLHDNINILDVATGTGTIPFIILENEILAKIEILIGIDISEQMIGCAVNKIANAGKKAVIPKLKFIVCDVEKYDVICAKLKEKCDIKTPDKFFDIIFLSFAFTWFSNKEMVFIV